MPFPPLLFLASGLPNVVILSGSTGWTRPKQNQLWLTVTRAFQKFKELGFGGCHEKAKSNIVVVGVAYSVD